MHKSRSPRNPKQKLAYLETTTLITWNYAYNPFESYSSDVLRLGFQIAIIRWKKLQKNQIKGFKCLSQFSFSNEMPTHWFKWKWKKTFWIFLKKSPVHFLESKQTKQWNKNNADKQISKSSKGLSNILFLTKNRK